MPLKKDIQIIPDDVLVSKIYFIRKQKVMLDSDLAELYGVGTGVLNQAVKRNIGRFPHDFMFQINEEEWENLKSQFVISSWGGRRKLPFVFTEQGVAMLSSVLSSEIAIEVNIRIIRIFTKLREMLLNHKDILLKMEKIERDLASQGENIQTVFDYLNQFIQQNETPREKIGFRRANEN